MGVYIKGMVPDYEYCTCKLIRRDGVCYLAISTDFEIGEDYKIHTNWTEYPLVPVPPHGRLIDADALECDGVYTSAHGFQEAFLWAKQIDDAPTIIPAENATDQEKTQLEAET